jgi:hypothetical protein
MAAEIITREDLELFREKLLRAVKRNPNSHYLGNKLLIMSQKNNKQNVMVDE